MSVRKSLYKFCDHNKSSLNKDPSVKIDHEGIYRNEVERFDGHKILEDSENELEARQLSESIFSMLLIVNTWTSPFFFVVFCVIFQFAILILLISDLIDAQSDYNLFKVPPMVSIQISIAQALAIYLAVCTSDDIIDVLLLFHVGFDKEISKKIPGITKLRWFLSCSTKLLEGLASLFIILSLIVQSSSVLSLFLNFAALAFVWGIDDVFFGLAKNGLFTKSIQKCAESVSAIKMKTKVNNNMQIRGILFHFIAAASFGFWCFFFSEQRSGRFMCNSLLVQFGDEYEPFTSRIGGIFDLKIDRKLGSRGHLYEHISKNPNNESDIIAYCTSLSSWTLSSTKSDSIHPCDESRILAKSGKTKSYDVTTMDSKWYVKRTENKRAVYGDYDYMKLECLDCDKNINHVRSSCSNSGTCKDGRCLCQNSTGLSCEFDLPCEEITAKSMNGFNLFCDEGLPDTPRKTEKVYNDTFKLMRERDSTKGKFIMIQQKPVYYQELKVATNSCIKGWNDQLENPPLAGITSNYALVFFNGLRWVITHSTDLVEFIGGKVNFSETELVEYLDTQFDPAYSKYRGRMYSSEVRQSYVLPNDISWYRGIPNKYLKYEKQGSRSIPATMFSEMECKS